MSYREDNTQIYDRQQVLEMHTSLPLSENHLLNKECAFTSISCDWGYLCWEKTGKLIYVPLIYLFSLGNIGRIFKKSTDIRSVHLELNRIANFW